LKEPTLGLKNTAYYGKTVKDSYQLVKPSLEYDLLGLSLLDWLKNRIQTGSILNYFQQYLKLYNAVGLKINLDLVGN
jgi:hypothetical protein